MLKQTIKVRDRLRSSNPLSPVVRAGHLLFLSGRTGTVDHQGNMLEGIEAQTRQCFEDIKEVLEAAGACLDDVVKVNVLILNSEDFSSMNEVYKTYWSGDPPARTTAVTGLARPGALIEVDCIAYSRGDRNDM